MRILTVAIVLMAASCRDPVPRGTAATSSITAAASAITPPWHPHKLSRLDATTFCAELREGGITPLCVGGPGGSDTDVFEIPGRQRTEAHGIIVSFNNGHGSFDRWIEDSLKDDAGVDPVYHYSQRARMAVTFNGDVPEETLSSH